MKKLIQINAFKDGGTSVWMEPEVYNSIKNKDDAEKAVKYYLDNRLESQTKGELFDRYPSDKGAIMLDKSEFEFLESR